MTNDLARGYMLNTDCGQAERSESDGRPGSTMREQNFSRGTSLRILRLPQVMQQTGLKKTTLYALQAEGTFPKRIRITSYAVGWIEEEVQQWILRRVAASNSLRRK